MRKALLITYTMLDPSAVGVFFRALRLAAELRRRDWQCVVFNYGPIPADPKVAGAGPNCHIYRFESDNSTRDFERIVALYRAIDPDVILFGEYPLPFMEPLLMAARVLVKPPLLLIDQYYSEEAGEVVPGVDCFLMYGLQSLWPSAARKHSSHRIVPPFIDRVTPRAELPVPAALAAVPWVTVVGFESRVLRAGIDILAELHGSEILGITLSHAPDATDRMLAEAGLPAERRLSLALQNDADLFGLMAASRAVVLGNGFMQMAEAIALGCPAVCVHRGIGMEPETVHPAFHPYVALEPQLEERIRKVRSWVHESPFTEEHLVALRRERGGAGVVADYLEKAIGRPRRVSRRERRASWWRRFLRPATLFRAPHAS